jgi:hypothetical protein
MSQSFFHRHALAQIFAKRTLSDKGKSGLFVSAARRTGKSTFIREDLMPEIKKHGCEVIYVDLWSDRASDPGDLILRALQAHIDANASVISKLVKKTGVDTVGGYGFHLSFSSKDSGATILEGLSALSDAKKSLIILIIDEAQHALSSERGVNTFFALKSARDELNSSAHFGFRLIATGSNRDKLAVLVNNKDHAFFGAPLVTLEHLGDDFLQWEIDRFEGNSKPSINAMRDAFSLCGFRPEYLSQAMDDVLFQSNITPDNVDEKLSGAIGYRISEVKASFIRQIESLPPLQNAVIRVMTQSESDFSPFSTVSQQKYKNICLKKYGETIKSDSSSVQAALEALREKSLIWKSARGTYAIEEGQYAEWLFESSAGQFDSQDTAVCPACNSAPCVCPCPAG